MIERTRDRLIVALCAALVAALIPAAAAAGPERGGFTFEVGVGVGQIRAIQGADYGRRVESAGVGPLSLGIGTYIAGNLAILLRTTSLLFVHDRGDGRRLYLDQHIGLAFQYWLAPGVGVGGGPGVMIVATAPLETRSNRGLGGSARVTWAPRPGRASALALGWELQAGVFLRNEAAFSSLLLVQWQHF